MDHRTVREKFLKYFEDQSHRRVSSSSLVPAEDPTLLFTNAGMNQFKDLFLGNEKRDYNRAASCQKCMRVSGKHNDFENVGHTPRHHTFFEMLGNFSFGDYFKADAIRFAWELLVEGYGLDGGRICATVFEEDDEAEELWLSEVSMPAERVYRLGAKDNFWSMGDTGPCGPCSELHWDWGAEEGCGSPDCPGPGHDCGRYLEIWNLVFMQFDRSSDGEMVPLPSPSVDTGMGLERITSLLQGVSSNYDTDLFQPILRRLAEITGHPYGSSESSDIGLRICADHLRAAVFLISDSVIPSNEGRGYVLRKLLRRALQHGRRMGMEGPFLHQAVGSVVETMREAYPAIGESQTLAEKTLEQEERSFGRVLEKGDAEFARLVEELDAAGSTEIDGAEAFRLHDTFGYPRERLQEMASERNLTVGWAGYEREMEMQRTQSREASSIGVAEDSSLLDSLSDLPPTLFNGYVRPEGEWIQGENATVIALFDLEGSPVETLQERGLAVLDKTPFYAESGGQVGDTGEFVDPFGENLLAEIEDTTYVGPPAHRFSLHRCTPKAPLSVGMQVIPRVDGSQRWNTMRNHTATHLLHQALKEVLGPHVRQAGSVVDPCRLRFDFNHFEAPSVEQLLEIEDRVNEKILEKLPVEWQVFPIEKAKEMGAQMLFGEKYGESVRVISIGGFTDSDYSREFCGGTHCYSTGEIGLTRISSERGIAAGVRRIEAVTGSGLLQHLRDRDAMAATLEGELNVAAGEIVARVDALRTRVRELEKENEKLRLKIAAGSATASGSGADAQREIAGLKVLVREVSEMDVGGLRNLADGARSQAGVDVLALGSSRDGKASFVVALDKSKAQGLDAVSLLRRVASVAGGGGGGRPDMAWGGGQEPEKVNAALEELFRAVEEALEA